MLNSNDQSKSPTDDSKAQSVTKTSPDQEQSLEKKSFVINNSNTSKEKSQDNPILKPAGTICITRATKKIPAIVNDKLSDKDHNNILNGVKCENIAVGFSEAQRLAITLITEHHTHERTFYKDVKDTIRYFLAKSMGISENVYFTSAQAQTIFTSSLKLADKEESPSESTIAEVIHENMIDEIRYHENLESWFFYNKSTGIWDKVTEGTFNQRVQAEIKCLVPSGYSSNFARGVRRELQDTCTSNKWDSIEGKLAFKNGTLDLKTKVLEPHNAGNLLTHCLSFDYDVDANCDDLLQNLREMAEGDESRFNLMIAALWIAIHGQNELKCFFELLGSKGDNGKSTFILLCESLIGFEYSYTANISDFDVKNRFGLSGLPGKRGIFVKDAPQYVADAALLKSLAAGESIKTEEKNRPSVTVLFDGLLLIATNNEIRFQDTSAAIVKRRTTIPFNACFRGKEKKHLLTLDSKGNLSGEWVSQLSGIYNYISSFSVAQVRDWIESSRRSETQLGLETKLEQLRANATFDWALDNLFYVEGAYLGTSHEIKPGGSKPEPSNVYEGYSSKLRESGSKPVASNKFFSDLVKLAETINLDVKKVRFRHGRYLSNLTSSRLASDSLTLEQVLFKRLENASEATTVLDNALGNLI